MTYANAIRIFISYGRKDARDLAIRLRDDLQAMNYSVWLDLNDIAGGASWSENIETAIEQCDLVLALMSKASYESQWCRAEQLRAIRKGKQIIPLRVQSDAEPPLHLEHMNYLDFADLAQYDAAFRDLVSDISAGRAFRPLASDAVTQTPFNVPAPGMGGAGMPQDTSDYHEKRTASTFRRHLKTLREETWLGSRYWWPYFLFYFTDLQQTVDVLQSHELLSPFASGGALNTRWDKFVRLHFRPRTPAQYHAEGFRTLEYAGAPGYTPIPVFLLFDMEALICHPESGFSDGDPFKTNKTYKTPAYFEEMPFEQIYHDSWFMPDEREEIMRYREAQVVVPDRVGLESLQIIWLRSQAEYETLHNLLPADVWRRWHNKITIRTDYPLFNNKRPFVDKVALHDDHVQVHFATGQQKSDNGPFALSISLEAPDGATYTWQDNAFEVQETLHIQLPHIMSHYALRILLDQDLAYRGQYQPVLQTI